VEVFRAAKERDVRGVLALLAQGVDPNIPCPQNKYTALIAAVFNQVVYILICYETSLLYAYVLKLVAVCELIDQLSQLCSVCEIVASAEGSAVSCTYIATCAAAADLMLFD
jgi:hypothetical protein